ncbi:MAG: GntR family transcriptional regulator [Desulfopila sp.]
MSEGTIYENLKEKILLLDLWPGSVIREKELMEVYGLSRTPIREAFIRLEMKGLVRIVPHIGTFVEEVSFKNLKEVFEVRSCLVGLTGRLAAERITADELQAIRAKIARMKVTEDNKILIRLDREIHGIINRSCKNDVLVNFVNELLDQVVRIGAFSGTTEHYWIDLVEEFEEIAEALDKHDGEATAHLLKKHTRRFVENISNQLTF